MSSNCWNCSPSSTTRSMKGTNMAPSRRMAMPQPRIAPRERANVYRSTVNILSISFVVSQEHFFQGGALGLEFADRVLGQRLHQRVHLAFDLQGEAEAVLFRQD